MDPKAPLEPRRRPRQRRSRETVDAILEAGARVFAERGFGGSSTNRIAEAAGVSIGSLYEYFPNKDALLVALAERHLGRMIADIESYLGEAVRTAGPQSEVLRSFVLAMLDAHEHEPELHAVFFTQAPHPPELHACVLQMEETLAHALEGLLRRGGEPLPRDPDVAAHLIVQTVEALTHRYVHHGIHDLPRDAFVDEVGALLCGYLSQGSAPSSRAGLNARRGSRRPARAPRSAGRARSRS